MKTLVLCLILALPLPAFGQSSTYVRPYVRSDGTYVNGYYRTMPDNTRLNNWSTQGNVNPYTGTKGSENPYLNPYSNPYNSNTGSTYPSYTNDPYYH